LKKKGKDLEVGDIIVGQGLVTRVEFDPEPGGFWTEANYSYLDVNDSYYGPCGTHIDLEEEYEIHTDREKIVKILKIIDCDITKYIADMMETRKQFSELQWKIIRKLNQELRRKKNEKKASPKSDSSGSTPPPS